MPPRRLLSAAFVAFANASCALAAEPPPLSLSTSGDTITLAFPAATTGSYRIERCSDLTDWLFSGQSIAAQGQNLALTYPLTAPRGFWRVKAYDADTAFDPKRTPLAVAPFEDQVWTDAARSYAMAVRIYGPAPREGNGPFPVVILSHGAGGNRSAFDSLSAYLATLGHLCVTLTHDDTRPSSRLERPADVSFALDVILGAAPPSPLLAGRVDRDRVGMVGHSFGAFTTLAIMGSTFREATLPGAPYVNLADPRVRAGVPLSPQGPGILGLNEHSWDGITRPVFTLRGTLDTSVETPDPATRDLPYQLMPPRDKYHAILEGADHSDFSDNGIGHHGDTFSRWYFPAIAAFFDATLRNRATARDWLDAQAINRLSAGAVELQGK